MTVPTAAFVAAAEACPFVNRDALLRALEAAQPHIAAAERERIRQALAAVADEIDRMTGHLAPGDRVAVTETLRQVAEDLDKFAGSQPAEVP